MMKRFFAISMIVCMLFLMAGCSKKTGSNDTLMGVSADKVKTIELYDSGEKKELSKDSEEFSKIVEIIGSIEDKAGIIDGGFSVELNLDYKSDYAEYSKDKNSKLYAIWFDDTVNVKYGTKHLYERTDSDVAGILIEPDKNWFGCILKDSDGEYDYATFADLEEEPFKELK
ncbi:MAG: hypothetical protein ACI4EW_05905 [Butyrivibrio sp.]